MWPVLRTKRKKKVLKVGKNRNERKINVLERGFICNKKYFYAIWHLKQSLVGYNITMHLHNDRSISDLLPWQTSDTNSPQINFIQTHLAALAKMATPKPETIIRTKPLSQQKRHRAITTINTSRKTNQETSNQSRSRVRVSTSSPPKDRSRNILNQSLH